MFDHDVRSRILCCMLNHAIIKVSSKPPEEAPEMPLPKTEIKPSSRHLVVDARFAAILEDDFDIETRVILDALIDEPQKTAIALCEWAS